MVYDSYVPVLTRQVFNRIITIYGAVRATPDVESSAELDLMDQFILRIRRQVESQFMGDMDYLEAIKDERQNLRSGKRLK